MQRNVVLYGGPKVREKRSRISNNKGTKNNRDPAEVMASTEHCK